MSATEKAILVLKQWFKKSPDVEEVFEANAVHKQFDVLPQDILENLKADGDLDTEAAWQNILFKLPDDIKTPTTKLRSITAFSYFKYAAVFVSVLMTTYALFKWNENIDFKENRLVFNDSPIILTIDGMGSKNLSVNDSLLLTDSNGLPIGKKIEEQLIYTDKNSKEISQHTLEVPNGKTYQVTLSDGTTIFCDAGTTLMYPSKFEEHGKRIVKLSGQAYFDVAKSDLSPFIVQTADLDVRVMGTSFNVAAYPNDNTKTVLVEGAVSVISKKTNNSKELRLFPEQMAVFNKGSNQLSTVYVDSQDYTSWMRQKLVFKEVPFSEILKTLERRFNVKIINTNVNLSKQLFTAKFNSESAVQILNYFKQSYPFSFEIKKNKIHIN